jgi:hypothetical protein
MANKVSEQAKDLAVDLSGILLFLMVLFLASFLGAAFVSYLWSPGWLKDFKLSISGNVPLNIGLPCAAVGAFGVVTLLLHAFPPEKQDGSIKFKVFGLEFTGPAGPITLWLACFLSFVAAIYWLSHNA